MSKEKQVRALGVLIIKPRTGALRGLGSFLSSEGYRPKTIYDPSTVLSEINSKMYQIVILYLDAGYFDGAALLRKIRSAHNELCVICVTSKPSVEDCVAILRQGAYDYLSSPLKTDELRRILRAAVEDCGLHMDEVGRLNTLVGQRLRALRLERRLILKQVASRTGLSVSLLSQIELGKSAASLLTLYKISKVYGVKVAHILEDV